MPRRTRPINLTQALFAENPVLSVSELTADIKAALEATSGRGYPEWLEVDIAAFKGTFKAMPQRSELPSTINESLVVELYSK